ncbi:transporter substrate-binding domain-containing protein, partial [Pseudomonas putida]
PYYTGGLAIMVKADNNTIKEPADLAGKKVSVQVGTKSVQFLKENFPKVERVEVEKNDQMFELVKIGRADAAVTGKPAALLYAKANP